MDGALFSLSFSIFLAFSPPFFCLVCAVQEFESASASSPTLDPLVVPVQPQAAVGMPYTPESFSQLGPAFSPL